MKIKNLVLISLIIALGTLFILFLIAIFVPDSTLNKVSSWFGGSNTTTQSDSSKVPDVTTDNNSVPEDVSTKPTETPTQPTTSTPTTTPTTPSTPTAPTEPAKCGGLTPCYGLATMASHSTPSSCWSYQTSGGTSVVYNMTSFNGVHSDGPKSEILAGCGGAINWAGVPNNGKHNASKNNSQSTFLQFKVGYYDASA